MASFICHSTSSLNCRISSARSCCGAGAEAIERDRQAELDVAARQAHAGSGSTAGPPDRSTGSARGQLASRCLWISRREQLGERRAHRLLPRRAAREVHVGVDGEAHAGHARRRGSRRCVARQPHRLGEPQPRLDAARIVAVAVVVEDALHPVAPHRAIRAVGEDRGVLDRDADLVVEAVRDPAADLLAASPCRRSASR